MDAALEDLQAKLGAVVPHELLKLALTHPSAVPEAGERTPYSNQRLEFLGDTVLAVIVAEYLFKADATLGEGALTQRKAAAVRGTSLAAAAKRLGLQHYLILGRGEEGTGGRDRPSILADAFEAVLGAIYLGCGLEKARDFVLSALDKELREVAENADNVKSLLQERTQAVGLGTPEYQSTAIGDATRSRTFTSQVLVNGQIRGRGTGGTKKEAEFGAAKAALGAMEASSPDVAL